jgi:hypothetical protein
LGDKAYILSFKRPRGFIISSSFSYKVIRLSGPSELSPIINKAVTKIISESVTEIISEIKKEKKGKAEFFKTELIELLKRV